MSIDVVKKLIGLPLADEDIDIVRLYLEEALKLEVLWRKDGKCYDDKCESEYIVKADKCYKVIAVIDTDEAVVTDVKYTEIPQHFCEL